MCAWMISNILPVGWTHSNCDPSDKLSINYLDLGSGFSSSHWPITWIKNKWLPCKLMLCKLWKMMLCYLPQRRIRTYIVWHLKSCNPNFYANYYCWLIKRPHTERITSTELRHVYQCRKSGCKLYNGCLCTNWRERLPLTQLCVISRLNTLVAKQDTPADNDSSARGRDAGLVN